MARFRSIRPELWSKEQFVELSANARLLYIGLQNFCDDGGNHPASPKTAKMEIFPGDDITASGVAELIEEIKKQNLITQYDSENAPYWHINDWRNLQKIEKPSYYHPPFVEQSPSGRRAVGEFYQTNKQEESKQEERESNAHTHEDEIENQKTATAQNNPEPTTPPQPSTGAGGTVTDIYAAISEYCNTDHGLRELIAWKKQAGYSDRTHGPTTGEVTKFISKYLDRIRATDPVQYFRDNFPAWIVRATEYNRPKKDTTPKYEPPPQHHRSAHRTNGNAHETHISDLIGKTFTKVT